MVNQHLRPIRYFSGVPSPVKHPDHVDMVIFRENSEDIYAGVEFLAGSEESDKLVSFLKSDFGIEKIRFTKNVGYSDHTKVSDTKLIASKIALALGASCIERHYTVLEKSKTKDGPISIDSKELKELSDFSKLSRKEMIDSIKNEYPEWEKTLGQLKRDLSHEEILNRDYYRGRFASTLNGKIKYNWE